VAPPAEPPWEQTAVQVAVTGRALSTALREVNYLRQCLAYPHLLRTVDQRLAAQQQPVVSENDFATVEDRLVLRLLRQSAGRGTVVGVEELWDSLDAPVRQRLEAILKLAAAPERDLERLPDTLVMSILDWRLEKIKGLLGEVRQLFREAQSEKSPEMMDIYYQQLRELPLLLLSINKAKGSMSSASRRRAS
jgi:hypothetical protein